MLKQNKSPYNVQGDLTQPRRDILKFLSKDIFPPNIVDKVWTVDGFICLRPTQHTSTIERFTTQWLNVVKSFENILHRELI